eukprot:EG_transcript_18259
MAAGSGRAIWAAACTKWIVLLLPLLHFLLGQPSWRVDLGLHVAQRSVPRPPLRQSPARALHYPTRTELSAAPGGDDGPERPNARLVGAVRTPAPGQERPQPGTVRALLHSTQRPTNGASQLSFALRNLQKLDWSHFQADISAWRVVRDEVRGLLLRGLRDTTASLSPRSIFHAMDSLAKLQQQQGFLSLQLSPEVSQLATVLVRHLSTEADLDELDGRQASILLWAITKLEVPNAQPALVCLCQRMMDTSIVDSLTHIDIATAVHGLGTSQVAYEPFVQEMSRVLRTSFHLPLLDGQGLANLAWGLARLGYRDEALMEAVAAQVVTVCGDEDTPTMTAQGVANVAWAFA